jgi:hypothetical protein
LTGAELAVSPGAFTIMGGVYNSSDSYGSATAKDKALLGRAEGMFKLTDEMNLGFGANVFSKRVAGVKTTLAGAFGSFSYNGLTLMGELDLIRSGGSPEAVATYSEIDYVVTPGVDLKVMYEFYDPDRDLKTGSMSRYSFGFEFFPISGVEVRPLYRISKEEPVDRKNNEFLVVFHFYL